MQIPTLWSLFLLIPTLLQAAEITGNVSETATDTVKIRIEGDLVPNISDPATIFFKLPGTDDEVVLLTMDQRYRVHTAHSAVATAACYL